MATSRQVVIICVLLLTTRTAQAVEVSDLLWGAAAGAATVVAAPYVVAAAGFGAGGIAAGSVAAKVMGVAWSTGVGTGAVATLQGIGAAGFTAAQALLVGGVAGAATTAGSAAYSNQKDDECK